MTLTLCSSGLGLSSATIVSIDRSFFLCLFLPALESKELQNQSDGFSGDTLTGAGCF